MFARDQVLINEYSLYDILNITAQMQHNDLYTQNQNIEFSYNERQFQKKMESGIGQILVMFFFISIYTILRILKWKFTSRLPDEEKVKKLINSIVRTSNYSML